MYSLTVFGSTLLSTYFYNQFYNHNEMFLSVVVCPPVSDCINNCYHSQAYEGKVSSQGR